MDIDNKLTLIKRNTAEITTEAELIALLKENKTPSVYLGTAITGKPHIGYFVWGLKLADFLKAGFRVVVLLADLHGALDNTPWELLEKRYQYYELVIRGMFDALGVSTSKLEIVKGSSFQLSKEYIHDLLKMATFASVHDAKKASSEVVKQSDNPKLSGLIYPLMQALDEEYLKVDIQYGGIDQRKILMFAREYLPKIGYKPRIELMTPLIPGLIGEKMSASKEDSKIDLLETKESIKSKVSKAYCPEAIAEQNGVLAFASNVIMAMKQDKDEKLMIKRPVKFGGDISFSGAKELEHAYLSKQLHPMDLKNAVIDEVNALLEPIRKKMEGKGSLIKEAYPQK
ncbi:tyrosine--tRNA ligase [Candidatus Woesearchaeota archaeon]|nr:tyrosine--tRNA ligase [Candidatus Woesearchaeota archaeon]